LIGSSTLVFLYYACFFSNLLAALHLLLMTDQPILGIVIFSLVGLNYLARITFWCSLEEEWTQQLPYIDDQALNTFRQVLIYIATTLNLDTPYWLYQIYHNGRRDGEIEYIVNLQRTGQTVFEHLPVLYITTFMFIHVRFVRQTRKINSTKITYYCLLLYSTYWTPSPWCTEWTSSMQMHSIRSSGVCWEYANYGARQQSSVLL
jgi:hypothetical protein